MGHLLPATAMTDVGQHLADIGGSTIERCRTMGRDGLLAAVRTSGLRGRGGAGFPTGIKWAGLARDDARSKFVVCNAAEGEPGTFKDRTIMRRNPYQVLDGLVAAAYAVGATRAFIGVKAKFTESIRRLEFAAEEMTAAGLLGDLEVTIVPGPDDYLFGEEKAMLEVIEGRDPLPRLYPPYVQGLFEQPGGQAQPALVNNVETLANVPHILARGPEWFRSIGTEESPGTMVCTVGGDTAIDAVAEIEMGTPLGDLLDLVGGGMADGDPPHLVLNGVSTGPLRGEELRVPISYEGMRAAGSSLGSAGFSFHGQGSCAVRIGAAASSFLYRGSCGQCPSCKLGTEAITERFAAVGLGVGGIEEVDEIAAWTQRITDSNRCGLGAGQQVLAAGILERFAEDVAHHLDGSGCAGHPVRITTIADWVEDEGRFVYSDVVAEDAPGG